MNNSKHLTQPRALYVLVIVSLLLFSVAMPPVAAGKGFRTYYELDDGEKLDQGVYKRGNKHLMVVKDLQNNTLKAIDIEEQQLLLQKSLYEREVKIFEENKNPVKNRKLTTTKNATKKYYTATLEVEDPNYKYAAHYQEYKKELKEERKANSKKGKNKK